MLSYLTKAKVKSILECVPKGYTLRNEQKDVLLRFERSYKEGTRKFLIDAPVGSGKSLIVMVLKNWLGTAHILTPRIALQNQYTREFEDSRKLVGRKHYPCSWQDSEMNKYVIPIIRQGKMFEVDSSSSCSGAICTKKPSAKRTKILAECLEYGPCPYTTAIEVASESSAVVSNYYSFVAQTRFRPEQFGHRPLMCIDEAHTLAGSLRDQLTVSFTIYRMVAPKEIEHLRTLSHWANWLQRSEQVSTFDEDGRDAHLARVEQLEATGEGVYGTPVIAKAEHNVEKESFKVSIIPYNVGGAAKSLLYDFADVVVLLSGTWYGKELSCREVGLDPSLTAYISVESGFPAENRPVILPKLGLDLSHKNWEANLPKLCESIKDLMQHHSNVRGLIHTSSYTKACQICKELNNRRVIVHTSEDFVEKMREFLATPNAVLVSPSCYEGVDLHDDRCRFNILTTLPYPSAAEGYFQRLLANNGWNLYNTICMRQIGQALGRGVRHKDDKCVSYLIDSRFTPFLQKMAKVLPQWFKAAFK